MAQQQQFTLPSVPWPPHSYNNNIFASKRSKNRKKNKHNSNPELVQCVKYGAGIAAGISVVGWIKRRIQAIPVIGVLATPFLCLMPTVLIGTAVGAAVVYGIDEGELLAAQKKVVPQMQQRLPAAQREVSTAAANISRGFRDLHQQHLTAPKQAAREAGPALNRMMSQLDAAATEAEASLAPVVRKHADALEQQFAHLLDGGRQRLQP
eukprot:GHRR01005890.1.p1 GENE.GHRR01005890.1~~GHRR01005890.1.p1  ORF type:complete len:208 (+),score=77.71 GHRR01005890.1:174-797(+)